MNEHQGQHSPIRHHGSGNAAMRPAAGLRRGPEQPGHPAAPAVPQARETTEAKLYKALDGLEAVISHNESDISTWEPNEYQLQLTYAADRMHFSPYMVALREQIRQDSLKKIQDAQ